MAAINTDTVDTVAVSEHMVFESIIAQANQSKTKAPEYAKCLRHFIENHGLEDHEDVGTFFKTAWTRFHRLKKSRFTHAVILSKASELPTAEFKTAAASLTVPGPPPAKTKRKSFSDLGARMKKERTDDLILYINEYVEKECPELSTTQLLGYLVHRINIQKKKDIAKIGHQLFTATAASGQSFEIDEAISMMHELVLSKEQMRKMRQLLGRKGIYFPTSNELLEGRKKLRPVVTPVLDGKGVQVQYKDLVKMTVESILKVALQGKDADQSGTYTMVFKDGGDGAGSQIVWHSTSMLEYKENMFQYGLAALKLLFRKDGATEDEVLWINDTPNSSRSLRPVFLVRESETDEDLLDLVIPTTDQARSELVAEGLCARYRKQAVDVKIIIHDTMKDLKFKKVISGLGGADCIICYSKQEDWVNRKKVTEGFPIKRTAEDTLKIYQTLVDGDGEVPRAAGDFATRKGLTQKPLTTSDQTSITLTHSYINVTTWFLKLLYRCSIDYKHWVEKSGPLGDPIRNSRDRVLDNIRENTGLDLDRVSSGGHGGTTTNGPQGRRFFSEEILETIQELLSGKPSEKHRDNVLLLHRQLSTILSVVSSSQKVDLVKFKSLCLEASYNICDNFSWTRINHTLHGPLHHGVELITRNDGYGLGSLSEECLESNNKDIRNYLQFLSRKVSPEAQVTDVMNRLLERSDPGILHLSMASQRKKYCTECGSTDHTIRSHSRLTSLPKKWYTSLVEDIFLD